MTHTPEVLIVSTGVANTASVIAGLHRAGATTQLTTSPQAVLDAPYVVMPGVGAFAAGMETLRQHGLDRALIERIGAAKPTLAVCLGLQLLARSSQESPGEQGLGILPVDVERFAPDAGRVPQMGWNQVTADPTCALLTDGAAYYANSYRIAQQPLPEGWSAATTHYGGQFIAAVERGAVLACQFHPELSGAWGTALLRRWLNQGGNTPC